MKRAEFFKRLGIGAATVIVAPQIIDAAKHDADAILAEAYSKLPPVDYSQVLRQYPLIEEECYRSVVVIVTKSPEKVSDGVYEIGLSGQARVGSDIYIPAKCTNKKTTQCFIIASMKDVGIYTILPYNVSTNISGIKTGTELVLGSIAYMR